MYHGEFNSCGRIHKHVSGFLVKVTFVSQEFHLGFTREVVSLSFTTCAHLVRDIMLFCEALRASYLGLG